MSRKFADEASDAIRRIFTEMETWPESKAVVGVYACGGTDNQWLDLFDNSAPFRHQAADYSPAGRRRYREDLRRKYGTAERLREAWGRTDAASRNATATRASRRSARRASPLRRSWVGLPGRADGMRKKHRSGCRA